MGRPLQILLGTTCLAVIAVAATWFWQIGATATTSRNAVAERARCADALAATARTQIEAPAFQTCVTDGLITMDDATRAHGAALAD